MRLRFELTGGVAGIYAGRPLTCDVALADLPDTERAALEALLAAPGVPEAELDALAATRHPDAFAYRLFVTGSGRPRAFVLDDVTAPDAVRPLLRYLRRRAAAERDG